MPALMSALVLMLVLVLVLLVLVLMLSLLVLVLVLVLLVLLLLWMCLLFHIHRFLDFWRRQTEPRMTQLTASRQRSVRLCSPPSSPTHSERPIHLGPQVHNTRNQATPTPYRSRAARA